MKVGTLIYDECYGLGVVIRIDPITDQHTVEFPEAGKVGTYAGEHTYLWEVLCK